MGKNNFSQTQSAEITQLLGLKASCNRLLLRWLKNIFVPRSFWYYHFVNMFIPLGKVTKPNIYF